MNVREIVNLIRGQVLRAFVTASNDEGECQTIDVETHTGLKRTEVEVAQPFGFASRAPGGGLAIVLAIGGDPGDLVALPVTAPGARAGFLEEGEVAIYTLDGSRVHIKQDGSIEVRSSQRVYAKVGDGEIELTADLVRGRIGNDSGAPRFVATAALAKLRAGAHYLVITPGGLIASAAVTIGLDPNPDV